MAVEKERLAQRLPWVDALKSIAAVLIVLHHFAVYGPLSDHVHQAWPVLSSFLYDNARLAVQVFLVVGGYLAAKSLLSAPVKSSRLLVKGVGARYLRLIGPMAVAVALAVVSAALVRACLPAAGDHGTWVPTRPAWGQAVAHLAMLQGVLGFDALSAGIWYVAIDFQLFLVLSLWVSVARWPIALIVGVAALCLASWLVFNRQPQGDNWAPYFFGAYGAGVLAWMAQGSRFARAIFAATLLGACVALSLDFRIRLVVAALCAISLAGWGDLPWRKRFTALERLSQISYALFLVHFPVLLWVNLTYAWLNQGLAAPWLAIPALLAGLALCIGAAQVFFDRVEKPLSAWRFAQFQRFAP